MKGNIFLVKTLSALPILTFIMLIAPLKASAADLPQHRIVPSVQSYGDSNKILYVLDERLRHLQT
jgi:hypothetical protein